jgi:hypothetical protein
VIGWSLRIKFLFRNGKAQIIQEQNLVMLILLKKF